MFIYVNKSNAYKQLREGIVKNNFRVSLFGAKIIIYYKAFLIIRK